jgi:hypothetical protein
MKGIKSPLTPFWLKGRIIPPFEKGGKGGFKILLIKIN